jgi:TPR repeat protein
MKRIEKNDPVALCQVGGKRYNEGDYGTAIEYWTKAAELGNVRAHYYLGVMYREGNGVEKDEKKGNIPFGRGCNWWSSRC